MASWLWAKGLSGLELALVLVDQLLYECRVQVSPHLHDGSVREADYPAVRIVEGLPVQRRGCCGRLPAPERSRGAVPRPDLGSMQERANELRRIPVPRTRMNKDKREPERSSPAPPFPLFYSDLLTLWGRGVVNVFAIDDRVLAVGVGGVCDIVRTSF